MELKPSIRLVDNTKAAAEATNSLEDDELVLLAKAGRKDAFELLVKRHQRAVLGFAGRFLNDPVTGRDVAQDVFLTLWSRIPDYEPRGKFRAYLLTLTRNRCLYTARQRTSASKKRRMLMEEPSKEGFTKEPLDELLDREKSAKVRAELALLPERTREVMILRYVTGLSLQEIAETTEHPMGTVKSHLYRGIERLNKRCAKERT